MTKINFKSFLQYCQLEKQNQCQEICQKVFGMEIDKISFYDFCQYILSPINNINDRNYASWPINMDLPLNHYYCHSSHNTYLTGNQLTSCSRVERYLEDLQNGIRCIEIDVHDGNNSEPIVKHGFTVTSSITFQSVIKNIFQFIKHEPKHTPIIISLQNHCSLQNQKQISIILNKYIENLLIIIPKNISKENTFPTLKQCLGKIIIKGMGSFKIYQQAFKINTNRIKIEQIQQQQQSQILIDNLMNNIIQLSSYPQSYILHKKLYMDRIHYLKKDKQYFINKNIPNLFNIYNQYRQISTDKNIINASLLHQTTILSGGKISQPCAWESISFSQAKIAKYFQDNRITIKNHTELSWIRSYPGVNRLDSSNYNPLGKNHDPIIDALEMGIQMIAINSQSMGWESYLISNMFNRSRNHCIGYRQKPIIQDEPVLKRKSITILSASHIYQNQPKNTIPSVQVQLNFIGSQRDRMINTKQCLPKYYTECIKDNAYNPIFNKNQRMTIRYHDQAFAFILFKINGCGQAIINLQSIKNGYRCVTLWDNEGLMKQSKILCLIQN